jgi:hypothetical protein
MQWAVPISRSFYLSSLADTSKRDYGDSPDDAAVAQDGLSEAKATTPRSVIKV